jgi:predicted MPP superfamily phosphohydrolase
MVWRFLVWLILLVLIVAGWGVDEMLRDPVVRRAELHVADWPAGAPPLTVALIGDVHVQGPDMPPARVERLVAQVNVQHPDIILLAGDYVGDRMFSRLYSDAEIARSLAGLRARLGVYAVLGNHDHWRDGPPMAKALSDVGIRMIDNDAVRVGPLTLIGGGDTHSGKADIPRFSKAAAALPGPALLVSHSPDIIPKLPPGRFPLILAAHTHCGQAVLPLIGPLASSSRYGERYRCGLIREGARTIIVTGGWGASVVPMRFGAPPDWWLITLGN